MTDEELIITKVGLLRAIMRPVGGTKKAPSKDEIKVLTAIVENITKELRTRE